MWPIPRLQAPAEASLPTLTLTHNFPEMLSVHTPSCAHHHSLTFSPEARPLFLLEHPVFPPLSPEHLGIIPDILLSLTFYTMSNQTCSSCSHHFHCPTQPLSLAGFTVVASTYLSVSALATLQLWAQSIVCASTTRHSSTQSFP